MHMRSFAKTKLLSRLLPSSWLRDDDPEPECLAEPAAVPVLPAAAFVTGLEGSIAYSMNLDSVMSPFSSESALELVRALELELELTE
jgi:hypothetical protein